MRKERAINGDEMDWCSDWRKVLCYCARPGVGRRIKRKMNKRARRRGRAESRLAVQQMHVDRIDDQMDEILDEWDLCYFDDLERAVDYSESDPRWYEDALVDGLEQFADMLESQEPRR